MPGGGKLGVSTWSAPTWPRQCLSHADAAGFKAILNSTASSPTTSMNRATVCANSFPSPTASIAPLCSSHHSDPPRSHARNPTTPPHLYADDFIAPRQIKTQRVKSQHRRCPPPEHTPSPRRPDRPVPRPIPRPTGPIAVASPLIAAPRHPSSDENNRCTI